MGHLNHHTAYRHLQARIDQTQTGFPETPETMEILSLLFTPEEAELVARLPLQPRSASAIARKVGQDEASVTRLLERMADKGLIFDIYVEKKERSYYMVAPPVVGFFEFSLMRRRKDIDQKGLAEAFERAMAGSEDLVARLLDHPTTISRALVHEGALQPDDVAEILPFDRASEAVQQADQLAVSLCFCRHKAEHLGQRCSFPLDNCMSMGLGADYAIRRQGARPIAKEEALQILAQGQQLGLVHLGDNVQRRLTYICSCCGCCCEQLKAINHTGLVGAVKTSAYVAQIEKERCTGCGRCARRCPVQAVGLHALPPHVVRKARMFGVVDEAICLGCGVCKPACRKGALTLRPRPERVLTPESTLERVVSMALEHDRLQHQLFDDQEGLHMLLLNRLTGVVLRLPPVKQALMRDALKSRFVGFITAQARQHLRSVKSL